LGWPRWAKTDWAARLIRRGELLQHGGDLRDGQIQLVDMHFEFVEAAA
jgi:hypothetical protein